MIDVEEVRVKVDVHAVCCLDGGPSALFDEEVVGDGRKDRAGWEGDERGGVGRELTRSSMDTDELGMAGLLPGRIIAVGGHGIEVIPGRSVVCAVLLIRVDVLAILLVFPCSCFELTEYLNIFVNPVYR